MNRARLPVQHARRGRGLSLIELLVAVGLGGVIIAGAIQVFLSNRDAYEYNTTMQTMQDGARFALSSMLEDVSHAGHFGCADGLGELRNSTRGASTAYENRYGELDYMGKWRDSDTLVAAGRDYGLNAQWIGSAIEGFDGNVGATLHRNWLPSNFSTEFTEAGRTRLPAENTDGITLRYMRPAPGYRRVVDAAADRVFVTLDARGGARAGALRRDVEERGFVPGAIAAVSNCDSAHLFTIRAIGVDRTDERFRLQATTAITTGAGNPYAPRPGEVSMVGRYVAVRYFVAEGRNDPTRASGRIPTLYRQRLGANAQLYNETMLEGVEDLQILYALDDDSDGEPNRYLTAAQLAGVDDATTYENWLNVVAVRISLLVRSSKKVSAPSTQPSTTFETLARFRQPTADTPDAISFACPSGTVPSDHECRYRRRVFTGTAAVRNL